MPLELAGAALSVETVTHTGALTALAAPWHELWQRCADATPFQSPEWAIAWWRHFGHGGLWTLVLRDADRRIVGIAPLYLHNHDGIRTVRLIGAGLSDYLDVLADPDWKTELVRTVLAQLDLHPERWDTAEFQQLPPGSPLLGTDGRHTDETIAGEPCPVLALEPGKPDAAIGSARLWDNIDADVRRIRRTAPVSLREADAANWTAVFADLRQLHRARWMARGSSGVMNDDAVWSFHQEAAAGLWGRGMVRLYIMRINGAPAGVYYGFLHRSRAYYYLSGFDPSYRQFGIGNQLVAHAIAEARRAGAGAFDFLRGQESYKYRWGAHDRATFCRRLYRDPVLRQGAPEIFETRVGTPRSAAESVA
jgi:CelD/BcsL family acetyltransferase involved in cellulose biosynthesis